MILLRFLFSCLFLIYAEKKNKRATNDPMRKLVNRNNGNGALYAWKYRSISISIGFSIDSVIDKANRPNIIKNIKTLNILIFYFMLLQILIEEN